MFLGLTRWLTQTRLPRRRPGRSRPPRLERLEDRLQPSTFTVRTDLDSGPGSLREAITQVNLDPQTGIDTINFAIGSGVRTIALKSELPAITHPVIIDGTTQRGFAGTPLIELNGAGAGSAANGLTITAGGSTVQGLVINRFGHDGILLQDNGGDTIRGNYVGTDVSGTVGLGNSANGVEVRGTSNNTIGGTTAWARNLISANHGDGLFLFGVVGNVVAGNYVGTDVSGTLALGNSNGIRLQAATNTSVGGTAAGAGNLISGNQGSAILAFFGGGNVVQGNTIGTDVSGTKALGNFTGLVFSVESNDVIGGTAAGAGNLISANQGDAIELFNSTTGTLVQGNKIGTDVSGTKALGNHGNGVNMRAGVNGTVVGGTTAAARNVISANQGDGILIAAGCSGNLVEGDYVGTDVSGTKALANAGNGVEVNALFLNGFPAPANNTIGGASAGAGNIISGNGQNGIFFNGFQDSGITGTLVQGNLIGTDVSGKVALGNALNGLKLFGGPNNNTIGGTTTGAGNVISGNKADGILVAGDPLNFTSPNANLFQGNRIGTDVTGTLALGNGGAGIDLQNGARNTFGGTVAGAGNVISANAGDGVFLTDLNGSLSSQNVLQGNLIGTDVTGTVALGNGGNGVELKGPGSLLPGAVATGPAKTLIGGTSPGAGNLISGNHADGLLIDQSVPQTSVQGNFIGTDVTGTKALGNVLNGAEVRNGSALTMIGGTAAGAGNLISGNVRNGVSMTGASGNVVQGNQIGTDVTGTAALGNGQSGVFIGLGLLNTIGGTTAAARNLISGNHGTGVFFDPNSSQNLVQGNYVGTDVSGAVALGNFDGVSVSGNSNTIGGTAAGAGNLISGNGFRGVLVTSGTGNLIQANFIGTDVTGTARLMNGGSGVEVDSFANDTLVGGTTASARNLISGNGADGILISGPPGTGTKVQGNYVGTDVTGTVALGNAAHGVEVSTNFFGSNTIGGTDPGAGNLISGNGRDGVRISRSVNTQVLGNFIGTTAAGTAALPNGGAGVFLDRSFDATIGGQAAGAGNTIAFNTGAGVFVNSGTGNRISANSIFSNGGLGIDLNQGAGANNSQPAPVLNSAVLSGGTTTVQGTLTAAPNTTYTIEFFANAARDPSGFGEGQTFLGSITVTTDDTGVVNFSAALSGVASGQFITATATDPTNNTSEFSNGLAVTG